MEKGLPLPRAGAATISVDTLAPYVLWPLLVAGLGEMFLYRMLSRVGVHVPKEGLALDVYDALVRLGSFAFDVASVMVFLALGLLAYLALRRYSGRSTPWAVTPALIVALGALSLLFAFVEESESAKFLYGSLSAVIMLLLAAEGWANGRAALPRKATVGLIVLAYLAAQYYTQAYHAYRALGLTATPPGTMRALETAEVLVVVNAFAVFWAWSGIRQGRRWRPSWLQAGVAGLLVLAFLGAYGGRDSSTAAILSLWTLGLTLYLPLPLYAIALALYGAAVVACLARARREPAHQWDAVALGLLPVAGLTLEMTYQHLIALVVLLLLLPRPLEPVAESGYS